MAARAGVAAAVYVSPKVYSLPVYQEFASLRPPLGDRTRLVIIIIINVLIKVMLNVVRCRGTLQSQWSKLTDSKTQKRMSMSHMRAGLAGIVAGTEQVVLQMTAEGDNG